MLSCELGAPPHPMLLGILAEGENYGYAIIQRVKELSTGQFADIIMGDWSGNFDGDR